MKKTVSRILSILLSVSMLLPAAPVMAEESAGMDPAVQAGDAVPGNTVSEGNPVASPDTGNQDVEPQDHGSSALYGVAVVDNIEADKEPELQNQTLNVTLFTDSSMTQLMSGQAAPQRNLLKGTKSTLAAPQTTGSKDTDGETSISITGELPEGAYAVGWPVDIGSEITEETDGGLVRKAEVLGAYQLELYNADGTKIESTETPVTVNLKLASKASKGKQQETDKVEVVPMSGDGSVNTKSPLKTQGSGNTLTYTTKVLTGVALLYQWYHVSNHMTIYFTAADGLGLADWLDAGVLVESQRMWYTNANCPDGLAALEALAMRNRDARITAHITVTDLPEDGSYSLFSIIDEQGNLSKEAIRENVNAGDLIDVPGDSDIYGFALVGEASDTTVLSAEDPNGTYRVTVTYGSATEIPMKGTKLVVEEIDRESDQYEEYYNRASEALNGMEEGRLFEIRIVDEETGAVYQPTEGTLVDVLVELLKANYRAGQEAHIVHMGQEPEVLDVNVTRDGDNYTYAFQTGSFSPFMVGYTVDFWYNGYTHSILGGGSIMLSEIFEDFHIKVPLTDVTGVEFTNTGLVSVEKEGNDWRLTSLAPFDTEEKLTVMLKDGSRIEIKVLDAQDNKFEVKWGTNDYFRSTWKEIIDLANTANAAVTITMNDDYTFNQADQNKSFTKKYAFTLDGNGHTITRGNDAPEDLISITENTQAVTIKNITINGNENVDSIGAIIKRAGSNNMAAVTLDNLTISGGKTNNELINITADRETRTVTVNMSSCVVRLQKSTGHAFRTNLRATINMTDCQFTGADVATSKSVIKTGDYPVSLTNVSVTGHTASIEGICAVDVSRIDGAGNVKVSGNTSITGNTDAGGAANLSVQGTNVLNIPAGNALTGTVGVTTPNNKAGDQFGTAGADGIFINDKNDYLVSLRNGNNLYWAPATSEEFNDILDENPTIVDVEVFFGNGDRAGSATIPSGNVNDKFAELEPGYFVDIINNQTLYVRSGGRDTRVYWVFKIGDRIFYDTSNRTDTAAHRLTVLSESKELGDEESIIAKLSPNYYITGGIVYKLSNAGIANGTAQIVTGTGEAITLLESFTYNNHTYTVKGLTSDYIAERITDNVTVPQVIKEPITPTKAELDSANTPGDLNDLDATQNMIWKRVEYDEDTDSVQLTFNFFQKRYGSKLDFIFVVDETGTMSHTVTVNVNGNNYTETRTMWARMATLKATKGILEGNTSANGFQNRVYFIPWSGTTVRRSGFFTEYEPAISWFNANPRVDGGTDHRYPMNAAISVAEESVSAGRTPVVIYLSDYGTLADDIGFTYRDTLEGLGLVYPVMIYPYNAGSGARRIYYSKDSSHWKSMGDDPNNLIVIYREIILDAISKMSPNTIVEDDLSAYLDAIADSTGATLNDAILDNGTITWGLNAGKDENEALQALENGIVYTKTVVLPLSEGVYSGSMPTNGDMRAKDGETELNRISASNSPLLQKPLVLVKKSTNTDGSLIQGAKFTLSNGSVIWDNLVTDADGEISIPWASVDSSSGVAFLPGSSYTLVETETADGFVRPGNSWTLEVGADYQITAETGTAAANVNYTNALDAVNGKFEIYNNIEPTVTYNANGGKFEDNTEEFSETVDFGNTETTHTYTVNASKQATRDDGCTSVGWNTAADGSGTHYAPNDTMIIYRNSDTDDEIVLYAQYQDTSIARVSNDGGTTWKYFEALVDGTYGGTENIPGAFTYANTLTGDVIIETLLETHERYTMPSGATFNKANTTYTLRTTTDTTWNPSGFRSTIRRGHDTGSNANQALIFTSRPFTVENIIFDGREGSTQHNGRAISSQGSSLTILSGTEFHNFSTAGNGGALYSDKAGSTLSIGEIGGEQVIFTNCRATAGGGIYQEAGNNMILTNVTFGKANVSDKGCFAELEGGSVYSNSSSSTITDCSFYYSKAGSETNQTKTHGGAICQKGSGSYQILGCVFDHCSVHTKSTAIGCGNGGAVYLDQDATQLIIDKSEAQRSSFTNCSAFRYGGAVIMEKNGECSLSISNTDFADCYTTFRDGGAVYTDSDVTSFTDCTFRGCHSDSTTGGAANGGGAIYTNGDTKDIPSTIAITGCVFEDCYVKKNGGAIHFYSTGTNATLTNVHITGHKSLSAATANAVLGSAIYSRGNITVKGGTITGCSASAENGGAVNVISKKMYFEGSVNISGNTNTGYDTGTEHNVILDQNNNTTINTTDAGLSSNAQVGIYVTGKMPPATETDPFKSRGGSGDPFGTYLHDGDYTYFINDRLSTTGRLVRGVKRPTDSTNIMYWESVTLTIAKFVTGEMGDQTKDFTFTLTGLTAGTAYTYKLYSANDGTNYTEIAGPNGDATTVNGVRVYRKTADRSGAITFTLKHWQKIELMVIPINARVTLTEQTDYYTASFTAAETDSSPAKPVALTTLPSGATGSDVNGVSLTVAENTTLTVTNNLNAVSPTGISFNYLPYILMLLFGGLLLLLRRRKLG